MNFARCERCQTELSADDLRCAVCGLSPPRDQNAAEGEHLEIVRCPKCHAVMSYSAEARAPLCPYCATTMKLEVQPDPVEQAQFWLPFQVDQDEARQALRGWLKKLGFFRPSELASRATLESLRAQFWPAWIFSVSALVSWTADSDMNRRRAPWAPHAGQSKLEFEHVLVSASHGLSAEECADLTPAYDLRTSSAHLEGPADAQVELFDLSRGAARRRIVRAVEARCEDELRTRIIPGRLQRKVHSTVLLRELSTRRVSLPAWVLAYRYRKKLYRAVIHGQDAGVVMGTAPWSWAKILGVAGAVVGAIALVILIAALSGS